MRLLSDWRVRGGLAALALGTLAVFTLSSPSGSTGKQSGLASAPLSLFMAGNQGVSAAPNAYRMGNTPLFFEPNAGQVHADVKYLSRGPGYTLFLTADEAVFQLAGAKNTPKAVVRSRLVNANRHALTQGEKEQPGRSNYFAGNDKQNWHTNIANYGRVRYQSVYPGIDLVYYGNQGQLEYDFIVQPGAKPDSIRFQYDGADSLHIDTQGNLHAETSAGPLTQYKPVAYQEINGQRHSVDSRFVLAQNEVRFQLGDYDKAQPLVIDPVLVYSTFMGGGAAHSLNRIAVDAAGNSYVAGYTDSTSYPVKNALPSSTAPNGLPMAIITKLSSDGSTLLYSTYLGGTDGANLAFALGLASDNSVYVGGLTTATNFPLENAFQSTNKNSKGSAFLARLDPSGQALQFSTYLSGEDYDSDDKGSVDVIYALAVRKSDDAVIVTGQSGGNLFPTTPGVVQETDSTTDSHSSAFVSAFAINGSRIFSSYLGGSKDDVANAIALDASDRIYLVGTTSSCDFPGFSCDPNAANNQLHGATDAFFTRLNVDATAIEYSTFLGGDRTEEGNSITISPTTGDIWIAGNTQSRDFPIIPADPAQAKTHNEYSPFLIGMQQDGTIIRSRILGKLDAARDYNRFGQATSVATDSLGNIFVSGFQFLPDIDLVDNITTPAFPAIPEADQKLFISPFVSKFQPDGATVIYTTDLRGSGQEINVSGVGGIQDIAVDHTGALYVTGTTQSSNFPIVNAIYPGVPVTPSSGNWYGFVAKIGKGPKITMSLSPATIASGGSSTLAWSASTDAVSCKSSGYPTFNNDPEMQSGSITVSEVAGDHVYQLSCTDADGNTSTAFATLHVAGPPQITLSMLPSAVITNQSSQFSWSAYDAEDCEGLAPASFVGSKGNTGSISLGSSTAGSFTYELKCTGIGGSATQSATLTVYNPPAATFTALSPPNVGYAMTGEAINWTWNSTDTTSCEMTGAHAESGLPASGSRATTPVSYGTVTATITCTGPTGATVSATQSIPVYDNALPPSLSLTSNRAPGNTLLGKQSVLFSWTTENAQDCIATNTNTARPEVVWDGKKPVNGTTEVTPREPVGGYGSSTTYTLKCLRPGTGSNSISDSIVITVKHPRPTHSAWLSPDSIDVTQTSSLNWSSTDAVDCQLSGNDFIGATPITVAKNGTYPLTTPATEGSYKLWISCRNHDNVTSILSSVTLTVTPEPSKPAVEDKGNNGSADWLFLTGIALLGWRWRQQRRS